MITILGTAHVFDLRSRLRHEIRMRSPQIVCLELDPRRLAGLLQKTKRGSAPLFYRLLASFQERLAHERGIEPGSEMVAAYEAARESGAKVALIDRDVQETFGRLWATMPFLEKVRFAGSSVVGMVLPGKSVEAQVEEVSADYAAFFEKMGDEFPTVRRVLIDERNEHMAKALFDLDSQGLRVIAVVGDGHVDGIVAILHEKGVAADVLRLAQLRSPLPTHEASFSVTVDVSDPSRRGRD